jgi:hypothetical protein
MTKLAAEPDFDAWLTLLGEATYVALDRGARPRRAAATLSYLLQTWVALVQPAALLDLADPATQSVRSALAPLITRIIDHFAPPLPTDVAAEADEVEDEVESLEEVRRYRLCPNLIAGSAFNLCRMYRPS